MKQRTIEILIQPSGSIEIEAVGFTGTDCEQATAFLEAALGSVARRKRKPEYYRATRRTRVQKVGQ